VKGEINANATFELPLYKLIFFDQGAASEEETPESRLNVSAAGEWTLRRFWTVVW